MTIMFNGEVQEKLDVQMLAMRAALMDHVMNARVFAVQKTQDVALVGYLIEHLFTLKIEFSI